MAKKSNIFTPSQVDKKLLKSEWVPNKQRTQLTRTFEFDTYLSGLAFVARIAVYAEVLQHHPVVELSFKKVTIKLTTHDEKGLTQKDFAMVQKIDSMMKF